MELCFFFRFVAGHPRNDLKQDSTYLIIDKYNYETKSWSTILRDNDWETEFEWIRGSLAGTSEVEIRWYVPQDQESGMKVDEMKRQSKIGRFEGFCTTFQESGIFASHYTMLLSPCKSGI